MAYSGRSTASRGWRRGRYGSGGVPAGLRWVGRGSGQRRDVGALGGGDVDGGGARLARWGERDGGGTSADEKPSVRGRAKEEGNIWGGLLSRVNPRPRTKGPFVPGRGFTRDKRGFWAGRENSQPAAHL